MRIVDDVFQVFGSQPQTIRLFSSVCTVNDAVAALEFTVAVFEGTGAGRCRLQLACTLRRDYSRVKGIGSAETPAPFFAFFLLLSFVPYFPSFFIINTERQ